jgi:hypothetical protein
MLGSAVVAAILKLETAPSGFRLLVGEIAHGRRASDKRDAVFESAVADRSHQFSEMVIARQSRRVRGLDQDGINAVSTKERKDLIEGF